MKLTKLLLAFLALCLILTLTGCGEDGDGSNAFNSAYEEITKGSSKKFVVYDLASHEGIENFQRVSGGIKFKEGEVQWEIYITINLNNNKQFSSSERALMNSLKIGNSQFTGTWSQSGQTITTHATKEKDVDSGQTQPCDLTEKTTLSADGNTMTDIDENPTFHGKFIYKKQ